MATKPKVVDPVEEQNDDDQDDMTNAPAWAKTLYRYMKKLDEVVNGGEHEERAQPSEEKPKSKHWLFGEE